MPRIRQVGVLELSEEEFATLVEIFERLPEHIMLASTYMAIQFGDLNVPITDAIVAEFIRMMELPDTEDKEKKIIDRILEFRSKAVLTIS